MKITMQGLWWLVGLPVMLWLLGSRNGGDGVTPAAWAVVALLAFNAVVRVTAGWFGSESMTHVVLSLVAASCYFAAAGWLLWGVL